MLFPVSYILSSIHCRPLIGWRLLEVKEMARDDKLKTTPLSGAYRTPVFIAIAFQILTLIATSLFFDFGISFRIAAASLIPFWISVLIIASRRPMEPTGFDRQFIAYGYPVLVFALVVLCGIAGV